MKYILRSIYVAMCYNALMTRQHALSGENHSLITSIISVCFQQNFNDIVHFHWFGALTVVLYFRLAAKLSDENGH